MNYIKYILFILVILVFTQCKMQQFAEGSSRNGECFAKCLIQEEVIYDEYIVYTGDETKENVDVAYEKIIIQPKSEEWIKKKVDRNCLSADPNDCLVWCLVKTPEQSRTFLILKDTTQSQNYTIEKVEKVQKEKSERNFEWREVVCENDVSKSLIIQIQERLAENGYYQEGISGELDVDTKQAILLFQENNRLPVGQLDFETLDVLGVVD